MLLDLPPDLFLNILRAAGPQTAWTIQFASKSLRIARHHALKLRLGQHKHLLYTITSACPKCAVTGNLWTTRSNPRPGTHVRMMCGKCLFFTMALLPQGPFQSISTVARENI